LAADASKYVLVWIARQVGRAGHEPPSDRGSGTCRCAGAYWYSWRGGVELTRFGGHRMVFVALGS
jgi:hypothetical protein